MNRKHFVKNTLLGIAALSFNYAEENDIEFVKLIERVKQNALNANATTEIFWREIRQLFALSNEVINLNNAAVSSYSIPVAQLLEKYNRRGNEAPSYYMWNEIGEKREILRENLADYLHCDKDELAFNRNTTEALNTIIFGLQMQKGDEVVVCKYDYPHMINAWQQKSEREGIVIKWVDVKPDDEKSIAIENFQNAFSSKTKVVHLTQVFNWTGYTLPLKAIINIAKSIGAEVIVDAAHALGQLPINIKELDCDYWAAPGHKWLCGPTGTGILYVKRQHIEKIFPLLSAFPSQKNDIRKFETLGVRNFAQEASLIAALEFHKAIGMSLIQERLEYLKKYWLNKVNANQNIGYYTTDNNAIASIYFKNKNAKLIEQQLMSQYKIHTTTVMHQQINGLRISPHIYTQTEDLDLLTFALNKLV